MKVGDLLDAAAALLDTPDSATTSVWPRSVAVLTRQAIETTLFEYWRLVGVDMRGADKKAQWLALPAYLGRTAVIPAAELSWRALSEACHQRAYDVGLTEAELRAHVATAREFRAVVGAAVLKRAARR